MPRGNISTRSVRLATVSALGMVWLVISSACESKTVSYNSFLSGLPGAEQTLPYRRDIGDYRDPTLIPENEIVQEIEPKKKKLIAKTGRHLMIHIYTTVDENDADLFVDQVLSTATKRECADRGVDPRTLFNRLRNRQEDLQRLFAAMPAGERTPGLFLRPVAGGAKRVQLDGIPAKGLFWDGFDMIMEDGNWKLVWMTGPGA